MLQPTHGHHIVTIISSFFLKLNIQNFFFNLITCLAKSCSFKAQLVIHARLPWGESNPENWNVNLDCNLLDHPWLRHTNKLAFGQYASPIKKVVDSVKYCYDILWEKIVRHTNFLNKKIETEYFMLKTAIIYHNKKNFLCNKSIGQYTVIFLVG